MPATKIINIMASIQNQSVPTSPSTPIDRKVRASSAPAPLASQLLLASRHDPGTPIHSDAAPRAYPTDASPNLDDHSIQTNDLALAHLTPLLSSSSTVASLLNQDAFALSDSDEVAITSVKPCNNERKGPDRKLGKRRRSAVLRSRLPSFRKLCRETGITATGSQPCPENLGGSGPPMVLPHLNTAQPADARFAPLMTGYISAIPSNLRPMSSVGATQSNLRPMPLVGATQSNLRPMPLVGATQSNLRPMPLVDANSPSSTTENAISSQQDNAGEIVQQRNIILEQILRVSITTNFSPTLRTSIAREVKLSLAHSLTVTEKDATSTQARFKACSREYWLKMYNDHDVGGNLDARMAAVVHVQTANMAYSARDRRRAVYFWALHQARMSYAEIAYEMSLPPGVLYQWILRFCT